MLLLAIRPLKIFFRPPGTRVAAFFPFLVTSNKDNCPAGSVPAVSTQRYIGELLPFRDGY